jgi:DNA-binding Xre family transcriptional regulator
MEQTKRLVESLKQILRSKGLTYAALAPSLGISEASVKRAFSQCNFTLERLEQICQVAQIQLADLIGLSQTDEEKYHFRLSDEQEQLFVDNPRYLLFYEYLMERKSVGYIQKKYDLSSSQTSHYLRTLEEHGLIIRLQGSRVKLVNDGVIRPKKDGPLAKMIQSRFQDDFLTGNFDGELDYRNFGMIRMTDTSYKRMREQLAKLIKEAADTGKIEIAARLPTKEIGIYFATRPWNLTSNISL